jgi:hypothetical protein
MTHKFEEAHPLSFLGYTLEEQHVCYRSVQQSINAALFFATRFNQYTVCLLQTNTVEKRWINVRKNNKNKKDKMK